MNEFESRLQFGKLWRETPPEDRLQLVGEYAYYASQAVQELTNSGDRRERNINDLKADMIKVQADLANLDKKVEKESLRKGAEGGALVALVSAVVAGLVFGLIKAIEWLKGG